MKYTSPIHIVAAQRSPIGRFGGSLKDLSAVELAKQVAANTVGATAPHIGSVIFGQVLQAGVGMNLARQLVLRLELGQHIPAYTVNQVCGSGLKAVALGAAEIALGDAELVLAGGAESMSNAPYYAKDMRWGRKFGEAAFVDSITSDGLTDPVLQIGVGETAEKMAEVFQVSREDQDAFALLSHQRACAAAEAFQHEIVPIETAKGMINLDEHPRSDTALEKLAKLKPAFRPNGTVTAGNASGINDGAAALLLASESAVQQHGLQSRARIVASGVVGCDPAMMGLGPVGAIRAVCEETGWDLAAVDAIEINEAFAVQTVVCARQLGLREDQLNLRGGGIALGHPIGCSGARVLVTLLHLMEDADMKRGIAALCVGGGMGIAMAIER